MTKSVVEYLPGLLLCSSLALVVAVVANAISVYFLDPLVIALFVGNLYRNVFPSAITGIIFNQNQSIFFYLENVFIN